jgi:hypothetical protein
MSTPHLCKVSSKLRISFVTAAGTRLSSFFSVSCIMSAEKAYFVLVVSERSKARSIFSFSNISFSKLTIIISHWQVVVAFSVFTDFASAPAWFIFSSIAGNICSYSSILDYVMTPLSALIWCHHFQFEIWSTRRPWTFRSKFIKSSLSDIWLARSYATYFCSWSSATTLWPFVRSLNMLSKARVVVGCWLFLGCSFIPSHTRPIHVPYTRTYECQRLVGSSIVLWKESNFKLDTRLKFTEKRKLEGPAKTTKKNTQKVKSLSAETKPLPPFWICPK